MLNLQNWKQEDVHASSLGNDAEKIRIVIVDDHPAFREGLSRLLREEEDLKVVAVAKDGHEAVQAASEFLPNVVIIDVAMPDLNGIEATRRIKAVCPNTAILVLSAYGYEAYVLAALQAGASGYLVKTARISELISAIRAVHAGETVLDHMASQKLFKSFAHDKVKGTPAAIPQRLGPRELEVIGLAAQGLSNKEIAAKLFISERTVQTHFLSVFRKFAVNSRIEAVLYALREGWITLEDLP